MVASRHPARLSDRRGRHRKPRHGRCAAAPVRGAEITLDGNPGAGALDLLLTGKLPLVSGTLAFDTLDLRSFLSAFTPLEPSAGTGPGVIDADFAEPPQSRSAPVGGEGHGRSIALTDVAATARVNDGFAAFDISDAAAFGGNIQAGLRFDRKPDGTQVEMRLLASEIDGGAFGAAAGMTRLVPIGRGTVSVILKGHGSTWDSLLSTPTARSRQASDRVRCRASTSTAF